MSQKTKFNNDWFFAKQPLHTEFADATKDSVVWEPVTLPHDWLIYDANNLYEDGEGWYRKLLHLDKIEPGTRLSLRFEGVYMNSSLYVNGRLAGTWKYGYSTFELDITPYLSAGPDEIHVQVIHEAPNSRWYSGAGIYRNVWLKTYPDTHLVADGIYIAAREVERAWHVEVETEIHAGTMLKSASQYKLRHSILDDSGSMIAQTENDFQPLQDGIINIPSLLQVEDPVLWDIDRPYSYVIKTELIADGCLTDEEMQSFGFRSMKFDSQQGFFLNGRKVKIHGVCQHHDLGCLGAAVNKAALRRQIVLLQEMGVNAIRTAHNMPAVELMELADEMGILIVSEAFDMWERKKTTYDYARFFPEWWKKDVASWVRRDRNRPSLLMWSIGNEIYDTHADERGQELTRQLRDEVMLHDPKANAVVTIGSNFMPWESAQKCADLVKFAGYNYAEKYYEQHHAEHPDWIIYGSETSSTVQSRGIYHFPFAQSMLSDDDEQCSSLGNSSTSWGAKSTEACIAADRDAAFSPGQFLWTGFDYIGEPTPYHTKNSYFGQLDTAGFKKDSFYIYQAEWRDYKANPMIHVFPYWDFSEGQIIDVRVCSNAPKIELFLNGESLGTRDIDHIHGQQLLGEWQIPYTKGDLRAVAYDENGSQIAEDVKSSFGDAVAIAMESDKATITADGSDLVFVEISVKDEAGHPVENANNRVHLTVEGPARLVGLDNGDSTDYDSYKGTNRRLFSGKLLAVIAANMETGTVIVRAESKGLLPCEIKLESISAQLTDNCTAEELTLYGHAPLATQLQEKEPVSVEPNTNEVPVRKLEIICPEGNTLHIDKTTLPVRLQLHPADTTYREVEWRVTNAAGVDTNIAFLQVNEHEAVLTALGDGDIYLRCGTRNGADAIRLYSVMEFHIDGLGQAHTNPYEFVSAGLHSDASRNLTNGNDRGVATSRDGESWICFDNINFGSFGSDEITLPIFSLDSEEFPIEIWEGHPDEADASLLTEVTYQRPSIWNVYQDETYRLPKRLKGITSLCFVLRRKIHLKGFQFKQPDKAFQRLSALDHDDIYGDSYTITADAITDIGNNVSLVFDDMDFGETGATKLVISGQSPLDKNTLHVLFKGADGESRQIVEFAYSEDYCEREFTLEPITGVQTVTFVFLPGSQFDFKWFQFV